LVEILESVRNKKAVSFTQLPKTVVRRGDDLPNMAYLFVSARGCWQIGRSQ
jgi:hypothetical protein